MMSRTYEAIKIIRIIRIKEGNIIPTGQMMYWSGGEDKIPDGWTICDSKPYTIIWDKHDIVYRRGECTTDM